MRRETKPGPRTDDLTHAPWRFDPCGRRFAEHEEAPDPSVLEQQRGRVGTVMHVTGKREMSCAS